MHLVAGTTLKDGQYLLNHVLDQQGIGWTYRATQTQLQQTVLIKTLNPALRSHPQFPKICQEFIDRTHHQAGLRHPSIVRVLDLFQDAQHMPFVVLEYLQGISLNDWMNDRPRSEAEVIQFLRQITQVLTYLQQNNLPHGNLKPRNILYRSDANHPEKNTLMLVGFAPSLMLSEMIAKRNPYSPPEFRQGRVTERSDLYNLAGLLYYCLTQHPPVTTPADADRLPLLSLLKPGAQRLLRSGTQLNPSDRPADPELWLSQLSKSRGTSAQKSSIQNSSAQNSSAQKPIDQQPTPFIPTITQIQPDTQIQSDGESLDISQKPTYLQDSTQIRETKSYLSDNAYSGYSTQLQTTETQLQAPASPPQAPSPPLSQAVPENPIAPQLPRYRTTPVTQFTAPHPAERTQAELPESQSTQAPSPAAYIPSPAQPSKTRSTISHRTFLPKLRILQLTALISALMGLSFGIILRFQASQRPGSSLFHTGQSFPPREWKGTLSPNTETTNEIFVEPGTEKSAEEKSAESNAPTPTGSDSNLSKPYAERSRVFDPNDAIVPPVDRAPNPNTAVEAPASQPAQAPASQPVNPPATPDRVSPPETAPDSTSSGSRQSNSVPDLSSELDTLPSPDPSSPSVPEKPTKSP